MRYVVEIMHDVNFGEKILETTDIEEAKKRARKEQSSINLLGFNDEYVTLDEYDGKKLVRTIKF